MDPVKTVTSNLSPGKIFALTIGLIGVFALLDLANATDWILYPVSSFKSKFGSSKG